MSWLWFIAMNASIVAVEMEYVRSKQNELKRAYDAESAALAGYMKTIKSYCTHTKWDGTSAITSGVDGLYEFCTGCGTTF